MAEIKISDLNPKGANLAVTDLLVISEDIGGGLYETKSITGDEVLNAVAKTAVAVRNQTGATIYKGTIVYISGTSGGKALISKAKADAEITSSKTLGVVTADIANNANGNVLTNGLLTDLDTRTTATHPFTTDTLVIGDDLYLSPTTAGYVTNVKPIAPNNLVSIGKVLETSATTGQILYAIVNGYELGELHNVDTTGAVSGNVLALNGGIWKPTTISSGITIGTTPISSGVAGRVLFEGAGNVMQEDSSFFWDNTNKRLGIGATPATNARLDIRLQGALSTDLGLRIRNSADTINSFYVNGLGGVFSHGSTGITSNIVYGSNSALQFSAGANNIVIGNAMSFHTSGSRNVGIGNNNTLGTNGDDCVSIGDASQAFGSNSVAIGSSASSAGINSVGIGHQVALYITAGAENVFLGKRAAAQDSVGGFNTNQSTSVYIGYNTKSLGNTQTNQIVIGHNAIGAGSNTATIGNTSIVKTILRGTINAANLPTSSAGLVTGDIWNNGGVLNIV